MITEAPRLPRVSDASSGTAYPGDEASYYSLNPGEAFAETYRVLSELRGGATTFGWPIVDPSFRPDATALDLAEQDVLHPYTPAPADVFSGRFTRRRKTWTLTLRTPLDGALEATLRLPPGAGHELTLLDEHGRVLGRGPWSGSRRRSLRLTICGQRSLAIRVGRRGAAGRFSVRVTRP